MYIRLYTWKVDQYFLMEPAQDCWIQAPGQVGGYKKQDFARTFKKTFLLKND